MLEAVQYPQQLTSYVSPAAGVTAGIIGTIAGLFVWLGGAGFKKIVAAVVGAVIGGICIFYIFHQNFFYALTCGVVIGALSGMFEKILIIFLSAVLAGGISILFLAGPHIKQSEGFRQIFMELPVYGWLITAVVTAAAAAGGVFLKHSIRALCFSTSGVLLIFTGMIMLLSYKGSSPAEHIQARERFFIAVFALMTIFGTLLQLLLYARAEKKSITKKLAKAEKQPNATHRSWRTT